MRFVYGKQDWATRERGQENVYLLTNGLGGFSCASMINSNTRNDQALLMASLRAPNLRYNMVNRLEETLEARTAGAGAAAKPAGASAAEEAVAAKPAGEAAAAKPAEEAAAAKPAEEAVAAKPAEEAVAAKPAGEAVAAKPAGAESPAGIGRVHLSSQEFTDALRNENGYLYLNGFIYEDYPEWTFQAGGVEVVKRVGMARGKNLTVVQYRLENRTDKAARLVVRPHLQFVPKGARLLDEPEFTVRRCGAGKRDSDTAARGGDPAAEYPEVYEITARKLRLYMQTDGGVETFAPEFCDGAYYAYDACDGRDSVGRTCVLCEISRTVPARESAVLELMFNTERDFPVSAEPVFDEASEYRRMLRETAGVTGEAALQLAVSADQFIAERESTGGCTILAGYPFFEDWGRDTMIALEGCCMSTGQYDTAKSILRTFASYCRKGLMPNLFPEGGIEPRYNTADAALLFINSVYTYVTRTGDNEFVREMWPVMTQIIEAYRDGTDYGIRMDEDGLIRAGLEYDQVTWMDVRIGDHLPTPRHGKPVEINACWYNALKVMEKLGSGLHFDETEPSADEPAGAPGAGRQEENGLSGEGSAGGGARSDMESSAGGGARPDMESRRTFARRCGLLAERTKESFRREFWMEDKGWLKDVLSGTKADGQFRCNQIWAVSMPFSMLDRQQERRIVDAVYEKLYTPYGLRTLSMDDPEFHASYGGELRARDLAYHQGTVWVFPMGAYYLAYLKTRDYAPDAVRTVRRQTAVLESALREGCIGQLPEIYDGERPTFSRGCFAQAWSVGEMLRVYEALDAAERDMGAGQEHGKNGAALR